MACTPEERRQINSRNGGCGKGRPKDTSKSRHNAVTHGMTAKSFTLPNEDPAVARRLADDWDRFYRPQDPTERHFVTLCVGAEILSGRALRAHHARVAEQVRDADGDWLRRDEETLAHLIEMLKTDPAAAVREIRRSASGCRWMIQRWEALDEVLATRGNWCEVDRNDAIRLLGYRPEGEHLRFHPDAWFYRMMNMACFPRPWTYLPVWLFAEAQMPERFIDTYSADQMPPAEEARPILRAMIADQLGPLREREAYLREAIEVPDRAEAPERALILKDKDEARLFLRYYGESRSTFFRATRRWSRRSRGAASRPRRWPGRSKPGSVRSPRGPVGGAGGGFPKRTVMPLGRGTRVIQKSSNWECGAL